MSGARLPIPVTIRPADGSDGAALERLAQLDSSALPDGPHLLAEREGRIDAALSLSTGELIADPFRRTAELCELLRRYSDGLPAAAPTPPVRGLEPRPLPAIP